jgi:hypothetical protein
VRVGGNHWVAVGGNVSVGSTGSRVGVTEGTSVWTAVGVGVGPLPPGLSASTDIPMQ